MGYYFYIARCSDNSLYSGACAHLEDREKTHNEGKGAKYTRSRRPIHIIYSEEFETLTEAMRREAQIKGWTRKKKQNLIKYGHPTKLGLLLPHH